jgi:hypothetical protein
MSTPGFQGSEHNHVEVTIYQHGDDPVVLSSQPFSGLSLNGQKSIDDTPSVVAVQTNKNLGSASGSFTVTLKPSKKTETLFNKLVDDDWIDIVFFKNDKGYHVMRGLIDEIRRNRGVGGTGATTETFTLAGRDFGKIWENTPVWFSPFANDLVTEAVSNKIFNGVPAMYESPGKAPLVFLQDFMESLTTFSGVNWEPPASMPGLITKTFTGNVNFHDAPLVGSIYFQNVPMRTQYNPNGMNPQGMLWNLAREYSDPTFTELYVDLLPNGDPLSPRISLGDAVSPLETQMTVILRDKPFPFLTTSVPPGFLPTWNTLPIHTVNRQEIFTDDVGKSGYERYNAFFVAPRLLQEAMASHALYIEAPLWDTESIKRHGLRRMDIQSNVVPDTFNPVTAGGTDISNLAKFQRQLIRDWYCMNPYLLSGTIVLGHGRPDIKIGNKLMIPGRIDNPSNIELGETYYIETVIQDWRAGTGLKTTAGVTRGWRGTDADYLAVLAKVASRYTLPPMALAVA